MTIRLALLLSSLIYTLRVAPDVRTIRWYNTKATSLADFKGRVVLIDFWVTWCGPCVTAQPELQLLAKELGPHGLTVILIHARDTKTGPGAGVDTPAEQVLPKFIADHKLVVPIAIADRGEFERLGIRGYPHYLLIDRRGVIRYNRAGKAPDRAEVGRVVGE